MTLRRSAATETRKGVEQIVYLLWYEWEEIATDSDPCFFRNIIESLSFQRALDALEPALVQLARTRDERYCLRVLTSCTSSIQDSFTV